MCCNSHCCVESIASVLNEPCFAWMRVVRKPGVVKVGAAGDSVVHAGRLASAPRSKVIRS